MLVYAIDNFALFFSLFRGAENFQDLLLREDEPNCTKFGLDVLDINMK